MADCDARRSLATLLTRTLSSASSSRSRLDLSLLNNSPIFIPVIVKILTRTKTSVSGYLPLNDPSANWSNRPPKETILLDGYDYEHGLIVLEFPEDPKPSEEEMIDAYVKTLVSVIGSEEEAMKRIYLVCMTRYTGFGALISEELSYKVKVIHRQQYTGSVQASSSKVSRRGERQIRRLSFETIARSNLSPLPSTTSLCKVLGGAAGFSLMKENLQEELP